LVAVASSSSWSMTRRNTPPHAALRCASSSRIGTKQCAAGLFSWLCSSSCAQNSSMAGWLCSRVESAGGVLLQQVKVALYLFHEPLPQTIFFQSNLRRWCVRRLLAHRSRYNARGPFRCNSFFHFVLLCLRLFTGFICLFLTLLQPWTFSYLAAFSQRAPCRVAADVNFNVITTGTGPWPSF
jgi:hypothetical protein